MSYREEDDKQLLIGFIEFLAEGDWLKEQHAKRMWLVDEYMKEKAEQREWGKKG